MICVLKGHMLDLNLLDNLDSEYLFMKQSLKDRSTFDEDTSVRDYNPEVYDKWVKFNKEAVKVDTKLELTRTSSTNNLPKKNTDNEYIILKESYLNKRSVKKNYNTSTSHFFTKHQRAILSEWLKHNTLHKNSTTEANTVFLSESTGLTIKQITAWYSRIRHIQRKKNKELESKKSKKSS